MVLELVVGLPGFLLGVLVAPHLTQFLGPLATFLGKVCLQEVQLLLLGRLDHIGGALLAVSRQCAEVDHRQLVAADMVFRIAVGHVDYIENLHTLFHAVHGFFLIANLTALGGFEHPAVAPGYAEFLAFHVLGLDTRISTATDALVQGIHRDISVRDCQGIVGIFLVGIRREVFVHLGHELASFRVEIDTTGLAHLGHMVEIVTGFGDMLSHHGDRAHNRVVQRGTHDLVEHESVLQVEHGGLQEATVTILDGRNLTRVTNIENLDVAEFNQVALDIPQQLGPCHGGFVNHNDIIFAQLGFAIAFQVRFLVIQVNEFQATE